MGYPKDVQLFISESAEGGCVMSGATLSSFRIIILFILTSFTRMLTESHALQ